MSENERAAVRLNSSSIIFSGFTRAAQLQVDPEYSVNPALFTELLCNYCYIYVQLTIITNYG